VRLYPPQPLTFVFGQDTRVTELETVSRRTVFGSRASAAVVGAATEYGTSLLICVIRADIFAPPALVGSNRGDALLNLSTSN
jgi:hypothetical protein